MKGKGLIRICTVFLVIVSMLVMNVPLVSAAVTFAPTIKVTNNNGSQDIIVVTGTGKTTTGAVYDGDVVKVYRTTSSKSTGGTLVAEGVAKTTAAATTEAGKKATVSLAITQIGDKAGYVYVEVVNGTTTNKSTAAIAFKAEVAAGKTLPISTKAPATVTVANYRSQDDIVTLTGQSALKGALVKVFASKTTRTILATDTIDNNGQAEIAIPNLSARGGTLYISVTKATYSESVRTGIKYESEQSKTLNPKEITVYNYENSTNPDYVSIASPTTNITNPLKNGDKIRIYTGISSREPIVTADAGSDPVFDIDIPNGILAKAKSGNIYITRESNGKAESGKVKVSYKAETISKGLKKDQVLPANNVYGVKDTITVTGAVYAKVYASTQIFLYQDNIGGTSFDVNKTEVTGDSTTGLGVATLTLPADSKELDAIGGILYVSFKQLNEQESNRIAVSYKAEPKMTLTSVSDVFNAVNNPEGTDDTITVSHLSNNDVVKIYHKDQTVVDKMGVRNLAKTAESMASITGNGVIKVQQLDTVAGAVYATVTPYKSIESGIFEVSFDAESSSAYELVKGNISMTNAADGLDEVTISGVEVNDVVTVYDANNNYITSGIVTSGTSISFQLALPEVGSTIKVSLTKFGMPEGSKVASDPIPAEQ